jgi:WD40 repeat protein
MTQTHDPAAAALAPKLIADLIGPFGTHLAFDREGARWALADDMSIQLGRDGALEKKLAASDGAHDVAWSADGQRLHAAPSIYDVARDAWLPRPALSAAMISGLADPPSPEQLDIAAAALSPDGVDLVIATRFQPTRELGATDGYRGPRERLLAITAATGALRGELSAGNRELRTIAIGDQLIAAGGNTVQLWDRQTLQKRGELPHQLVARALAFNAAGDRLAVITAEGDVTIWDVAASRKLQTFNAHKGDGYAIAFHPTLPVIATGGQDGVLRLWSLTETSATAIYEETVGGWVQAVAFAASGTRLAAVTWARPPHFLLYSLSSQ